MKLIPWEKSAPLNPVFKIPSPWILLFYAAYGFPVSLLGGMNSSTRSGFSSPESGISCEFRASQYYNKGAFPRKLDVPSFYPVMNTVMPYWLMTYAISCLLVLFSCFSFRKFVSLPFLTMRFLDLMFELMGHSILMLEFPNGVDVEVVLMLLSVLIKAGVIGAGLDYVKNYDKKDIFYAMTLGQFADPQEPSPAEAEELQEET